MRDHKHASSVQDYMENNHGKEIKLVRTTVKIPGQRPRGSESTSSMNHAVNGHANKSLDSSKCFSPSCYVVCVTCLITFFLRKVARCAYSNHT